MDMFELQCFRCKTHLIVTIPGEKVLHPIPCPSGCGETLSVEGTAHAPSYPVPQTDTSQSPSPQRGTRFFGW